MAIVFSHLDFSIHISDKGDTLDIQVADKVTSFKLDQDGKIGGGVMRQSNVGDAFELVMDNCSSAVTALYPFVDRLNLESWLRVFAIDWLKVNKITSMPPGGIEVVQACAFHGLHPCHLGSALVTLARGPFTITKEYKPEVAFLLGCAFKVPKY